jgi:uncharacterized GH25 family protein
VIKAFRILGLWPFARRYVSLFAFLLGLSGGPSAMAHDFWVQPDYYRLQPQVETPLTLQVGHGPFRQRSPIALSRITRFEAIAPNGTTIDLRERLRMAEATKDGDIQFPNSGTYVLVLETDDRAQSHLPAIRFNDYLKAEGLTPALEQRAQLHRMDADGSENYSRHAKAMVQVGPLETGLPAAVTQPVGMPLEIVLERNPYALPPAASLPIRVIFQGRPLAGALVKLTNLDQDVVPLEMYRTDRAGRATFTMPQQGRWLLNVIWTRPLPKARETDFETFFSSLSFGFTSAPSP